MRININFKIFLILFGAVSFQIGIAGFDITGNTGIVLAENPSESSVLAASELSKYIEKVSGIKLRSGASSKGNNIHIGLASDFKNLPAVIREKLKKSGAVDSYAVHVSGSRMYFAGKNKPAELYAVYQFLERELGIYFFKPANEADPGEYIPYEKRTTITVKDQTIVRIPAFSRRLLFPTGWDWWTEPRNAVIWSVKGGFQMQPTYYHRNRKGRKNAARIALYAPRTADVWEENAHCILQLAIPPEYFKTNPEYFALVDGKRVCHQNFNSRAYCLSNPDVRRLTAEYIIRNIREKKAQGITLLTGSGMADMSRGFCECDNCRKENGGRLDWRNISNIHSRAFKDIFDQVYKAIPDAKLLHWAYHTYRTPPMPAVKFDPRTEFIFMTHGRCYAHSFASSCHRNIQILDWLKEYARRFQNISLYEYFLCSGGCNYVPQELIQAEDLKFFHSLGVTGWQEEVFFEDSMTLKSQRKNLKTNQEKLPSLWQWLYLTGKMLWDPGLDPQKLLDDVESKYYGKAYPAMKKYHALRRSIWAKTGNCMGYPVSNTRLPLLLNDPKDRENLFALLDQAEKLAGNDTILLARIKQDRHFLNKYWLAAHREYLKRQGKVIKAPTASGKIVIDGKGTESAWKNAFYVTAFNETFTPKHAHIPSDIACNVGILSDRENLYFLVTVKEPMINRLQKGKDIWQTSSVEFFLHPQSASNEYYHFLFTQDGKKYEAVCPGNKEQPIGARWCCVKTKDGYTMEIRIPAAKLGEFRNGSAWKCNLAVNRLVLDGKLIEGHYSLDGNLYHDVTRFYPLQIGSPINVNGTFNQTEKNKRKYDPSIKILEKVPSKWYISLHKKNPAFGIRNEASPYDETMYLADVEVSAALPTSLREGDKVTVSFEAKGTGKIVSGVYRYRVPGFKYLGTDATPPWKLTDKWQKFTFTRTVGKSEFFRVEFSALGEAQVDNVSITVE